MITIKKGLYQGKVYYYLYINDGLVGMYETESGALADVRDNERAA
jgi:ribosomal protein S19